MPKGRVVTAIATVLIAVGGLLTLGSLTTANAATGDGCYTWKRTLRYGDTGADVRVLQWRLVGWAGERNWVNATGIFGKETQGALKRFQKAYKISPANGVADDKTWKVMYTLQSDKKEEGMNDCTPTGRLHWNDIGGTRAMSLAGMAAKCGQPYTNSNETSVKAAKQNMMTLLWHLKSFIKQLELAGHGKDPVRVMSGYRSRSCNQSVSMSQHTFAAAVDLVPMAGSGLTYCSIAMAARKNGFSRVLGPGFPGHYDHAHIDIGGVVHSNHSYFWDFDDCKGLSTYKSGAMITSGDTKKPKDVPTKDPTKPGPVEPQPAPPDSEDPTPAEPQPGESSSSSSGPSSSDPSSSEPTPADPQGPGDTAPPSSGDTPAPTDAQPTAPETDEDQDGPTPELGSQSPIPSSQSSAPTDPAPTDPAPTGSSPTPTSSSPPSSSSSAPASESSSDPPADTPSTPVAGEDDPAPTSETPTSALPVTGGWEMPFSGWLGVGLALLSGGLLILIGHRQWWLRKQFE